jgi:uncharacterized membrane protein YfcA
MSYFILMAIAVIAWVTGGILLYPALHWKGLLGLFLIIFAYRLEWNSTPKKSKVDKATDDLFRSIINAKRN